MKRKRHVVHRCKCEACRQHPRGAVAQEHRAINRVLAGLDERARRQCAGLLARQYGRGGISAIQEITGLSRTTIRLGQHETPAPVSADRVRRSGGGRQPVEKNSRVS